MCLKLDLPESTIWLKRFLWVILTETLINFKCIHFEHICAAYFILLNKHLKTKTQTEDDSRPFFKRCLLSLLLLIWSSVGSDEESMTAGIFKHRSQRQRTYPLKRELLLLQLKSGDIYSHVHICIVEINEWMTKCRRDWIYFNRPFLYHFLPMYLLTQQVKSRSRVKTSHLFTAAQTETWLIFAPSVQQHPDACWVCATAPESCSVLAAANAACFPRRLSHSCWFAEIITCFIRVLATSASAQQHMFYSPTCLSLLHHQGEEGGE